MTNILVFIAVIIYLVVLSDGHGMMVEPPGRASRWRYNASAPSNYNDNELFCGGFSVQWNSNNGKCGLCGDNYKDPTPRNHEIGRFYGEGVIVKTYKAGGEIPVAINITANHWGDFTWQICNMDFEKESDECFDKLNLNLKDGSAKYVLQSPESAVYNTNLQIPSELKCEHCVLRWTYRAGNTWGWCEGGKGAPGCGPQEHFRSCADIAIKA